MTPGHAVLLLLFAPSPSRALVRMDVETRERASEREEAVDDDDGLVDLSEPNERSASGADNSLESARP